MTTAVSTGSNPLFKLVRISSGERCRCQRLDYYEAAGENHVYFADFAAEEKAAYRRAYLTCMAYTIKAPPGVFPKREQASMSARAIPKDEIASIEYEGSGLGSTDGLLRSRGQGSSLARARVHECSLTSLPSCLIGRQVISALGCFARMLASSLLAAVGAM
jgi:hypothetical protein